MSQPARFCLNHPFDARYALCDLVDILNRTGLDPIQHAGDDRACRLPDDSHNSSRDQQADDRVGERIAKPDTGCPDDDGKAGQTVSACVIAIGDEGCAVDLLPNPNTEHRHGFIPNESDYAGDRDPLKVRHRLWMDESVDRLISRDQCTEKNDEYN